MRLPSGCGLGPTDHAVQRGSRVADKAIELSGLGSQTHLRVGLPAGSCRTRGRVSGARLRGPAQVVEPVIEAVPVEVSPGFEPGVAVGMAHAGPHLVEAPG